MIGQSLDFDQIIAPLKRADFLSDYWDKSFLHVKGEKGRFTSLLPWDELNHILAWHGPLPPQLRLFQDGRQVDVARYVQGQPGALSLDAGGLTACLAQGATLILDAAEKFAPRVSALAADVAQSLKGRTNVNLYAGWRKQKGFDLHWDEQDLIVLQLSGRKHWKVFGPTRLHPLHEDEAPEAPSGAPVWEGILEDGDMIYAPRGWWHVAWPLDEPSLHLTFSVAPANGADFLAWWRRRLLRHPGLRRNLAQGDAASREKYLADLLALMQEEAKSDLLKTFLEESDAGRKPLPAFRLPESPLQQAAALAPQTRLRLAAAQRLVFDTDAAGMPCFRAGSGSWSFPPQLLGVFQQLSASHAITFAQACAGIGDPRMIAQLTHALGLLAEAGIILKE